MNLQEEIYFIVDDAVSPSDRVDRLVELFKKWALEMVGEDEESDRNGRKNPYAGHNNWRLEQIRQRIIASAEESTKRK